VVKGEGVVAATPYPWPYHGALDPARCALVACVDPRWRALGADDGNLTALAFALRQWGALTIAVRATPVRTSLDRGSRWAVPGSEVDLPAPFDADLTLEAGATNAFYASDLDGVLRRANRSDLFVAGWGLEGPVHSTLRAANDQGYECLLVPDASSTLDPDLVHAAKEMVRFSGGIFGAWATTEDIFAALGELTTR
jgi:hypothetical protein